MELSNLHGPVENGASSTDETSTGHLHIRSPKIGVKIQPTTAEELLEALLRPVTESIHQPIPDGTTETQNYLLPCPGYEGLEQWREVVAFFRGHCTSGVVANQYFNGVKHNAAQMSVACEAVKAAMECCANMPDAIILRAAKEAGDLVTNAEGKLTLRPGLEGLLVSPETAVEHYFGIKPEDMSDVSKLDTLREFAKRNAVVRVYGYEGGADVTPCVIDFIDAGCGIEASDAAWESTVLSLNRGLKALLPIMIGKFGWGAGSSYQNADISIWASCVPGTDLVAFTIIECGFLNPEDRLPTFQYLTIDGHVPVVKKPGWWDDLMMPDRRNGDGNKIVASSILRHVGYKAPLGKGAGENSISGVIERNLPALVMPIWTEYVHMSPSARGGQSYPGHRRAARLCKGTYNRLTDSVNRKKAGYKSKKGGTDLVGVRHHAVYNLSLGNYDFGGGMGSAPVGPVKVEVFVVEPRLDADGRPREHDTMRNLVRPDRCVLFHLNGQTHHEHFTHLVTSHAVGADLANVGRRCVVTVRCDKLSREAKFHLFGSSREQMKDTGLGKVLLSKVKERLRNDRDLTQIDAQIAAERQRHMKVRDPNDFADALDKHLRKHDVSLHKLQRKIRRREWETQEQDVETWAPPLPTPILPVVPPTLLEWSLQKKIISMYPGQSYSWVLKTNAPEDWWDFSDPMKSALKVTSSGVMFTGADEPTCPGYIRCHFECPTGAKIGTKGFIQAQIDYTIKGYMMAPLHSAIQVEVVAKPKPKKKEEGKGGGNGKLPKPGEPTKITTIKTRRRVSKIYVDDVELLPPIPITLRDDPDEWNRLGWDRDATVPAFSLLVESSKATLYYNSECKDVLDERSSLLKKKPGLEDQFTKEFEMKLVLEGIFMLNTGHFEDTGKPRELVQEFQKINRATAQVLAQDVARELTLEEENEALRSVT